MINFNEAAKQAAKNFHQGGPEPLKTGDGNAKPAGDASSNGDAKPKGDAHMLILMDESGSMSGLEEAVVTGCNHFMHEAAKADNARVWLAMFDSSASEPRTRFKVRHKRAGKTRPLTPRDYNPRGMTPLNDAIVDAIVALEKAAGKDDTVFLAIITDGMENASETSTEEVKRLLTRREAEGWGIVFIGANQDTVDTAAQRGMRRRGRAFNFDANREGVRDSMKAVSEMALTRSQAGPGVAGLKRYDEAVEELHEATGGKLGTGHRSPRRKRGE